jgi:hypothetical protein
VVAIVFVMFVRPAGWVVARVGPEALASDQDGRHGLEVSICADQSPPARRGTAPGLLQLAALKAHPPVIALAVGQGERFGCIIGQPVRPTGCCPRLLANEGWAPGAVSFGRPHNAEAFSFSQ